MSENDPITEAEGVMLRKQITEKVRDGEGMSIVIVEKVGLFVNFAEDLAADCGECDFMHLHLVRFPEGADRATQAERVRWFGQQMIAIADAFAKDVPYLHIGTE